MQTDRPVERQAGKRRKSEEGSAPEGPIVARPLRESQSLGGGILWERETGKNWRLKMFGEWKIDVRVDINGRNMEIEIEIRNSVCVIESFDR
jgi:hypothetical protein